MARAKILIVDDALDTCMLIQRMLQRAGLRWDVAMTGRDAIRALAEAKDIDLVLLDIDLPDLNGFEVVRHLKTRMRRPPICFVTGRNDERSVQEAIEVGVDGYLIKPFDSQGLLAKVLGLLRRPASKRRNRQEQEASP
jgi:DNA-binding response OmpR family regulator